MNNTGPAILIVGFSYLGVINGWFWWNYLAIALGALSWLYIIPGARDKAQELTEAQMRFYKYDLPPLIQALTRKYTEVRK